MTKKNIMPVLVLTAICIVVAVLLAAVYMFTSPIIEDRNQLAAQESLRQVMEGGEFNPEPDELRSDAPETISKVFTEKNGKGTVLFLVTNKGYTGKTIAITLGVDTAGKITGVAITQNEESIVPSALKPGGNYGDAFVGKGAEEVPDLQTGVTVKFTDNAIKEAINDALIYLDFSEKAPELTEDELIFGVIDGGEYNAEPDTLGENAPETVSKVYTEKNGKGTLVVLVTKAGYTGNEIKIALGVGADGKILGMSVVKNGESIVPSALKPGGNYGDAFVGKGAEDIPDLETGVTVKITDGAIKEAVTDALTYLGFAEKAPELTEDDIIFGVIEGGEYNAEPDTLGENAPETVSKVYTEKNGKGTLVVLVTKAGYTGNEIKIALGVGADGKILGMSVVKNEESIVPPSLKPGGNYGDAYVGKEFSDVADLETGVTVKVTDGAIKAAVKDALSYLGFEKVEPDIPRDEAELLGLVKEFYTANGGDASKLETTVETGEFVKRIYREKGKQACIAYAVSISQYGTPEFEVLVYINASGKVADISKVLWKVSDAKPEWGYNPPSDEVVDEFIGSFVGKDESTVPSVDVANGVTNTSTNFRDAVAEAIELAGISADIPRSETELLGLAKEFYTANGGDASKLETTVEAGEFVKRIYREKGKQACVAYAVSISQYGTPEFEILVYIDASGKVTDVSKVLWKVSDAKPEWGYNPPSDEAVDEFIGSFVGKDEATVPSVDLTNGTTSTSTKLMNAVLEAIEIATKLPRDKTEVETLAKELYAANGGDSSKLEVSIPEESEFVKRIFRESGKAECVVYAYSISRYGTPEFEVLVYIDASGKVADISKVLWKVSDAKPEWGYNPPNDEIVDSLFESFVGKDESTVPSVDLTNGATSTSTKLMNAVLEALELASTDSLPRAKAEIEALAKELYTANGGNADNLSVIAIEGKTYSKLLFREAGNICCVVYAYSISQYGTPEFEVLVYIDASGKVADISKVLWKVSDAKPEWGYNPPSDETVDSLFESFVGKDEATVPSVDLTNGATSTSTKLMNAVLEAVDVADADSFIPRDEAEVDSLAKELYAANGGDSSKLQSSVKESENFIQIVYREEGKAPAVVYTFSISQYGTPEFEILVYIDASGKVADISKVLWKVSDAKPEWGYNPPSDETVDSLFESFVGKDEATVPSVDLTNGATSTSTKLMNAVLEAIEAADVRSILPRDKAEVDALAKELYTANGGDAEKLESTLIKDGDFTKVVYREKGKISAVVYTFSISQYGTPEFEILVYIDASGKVADISKVLWKVSDAKPEWGYNPPNDETVDSLIESFVGKDASTVPSVDLSNGATSTSTKLMNAVLEAIEAADAWSVIPKTEEELNSLVKDFYEKQGGDASKLTSSVDDNGKFIKVVYNEAGKNSYVVYTFSISQYGTPEFEVLVYIDASGKVADISKVLWKVSDAKPEWGYNPPSDEAVDEFIGSFVDKDGATVPSVDVANGVTNTSTNFRNAISEVLSLYTAKEPDGGETEPDGGEDNGESGNEGGADLEAPKSSYAPRIIAAVVLSLAIIGTALVIIINRKRRAAK